MPKTPSPERNDDVIASLWLGAEQCCDCAEASPFGPVPVDCVPTGETRLPACLFGVPCGNQQSSVANPGGLQNVGIVEACERQRLALLQVDDLEIVAAFEPHDGSNVHTVRGQLHCSECGSLEEHLDRNFGGISARDPAEHRAEAQQQKMPETQGHSGRRSRTERGLQPWQRANSSAPHFGVSKCRCTADTRKLHRRLQGVNRWMLAPLF